MVVLLGLIAIGASIAGSRPSTLLTVLGVPLALLVIAGGVGALYRFAVGHRLAVRALLPGAVTSAIGVLLVTAGFGAYVTRSARFTAVYGAFAALVIGMLAVYLAVYVVLIGAVLNMELSRSQSGNS